MKRIVGSFLALVLSISLAACGKADSEAEVEYIEPPKNTVEKSQEESANKTTEDTKTDKKEIKTEESSQESLQDELLKEDTYWTAYELVDFFGAEKLPADYKWIDLILWADGSAQLREVQNELILNNDLMLHMTWKLEESTLGLYVEGFNEPYCEGTIDGNEIALSYYGSTLYLRQDTMPEEIGELLSPAQLTGTWILASGMVEGWEWDARDEREYGVLFFDSTWDEEIAGPTLQADYESRAGWGEMRESFYDRELVLLDEPIYEGCGNEKWSVRIGPESPLNEHGYPKETDYYVTLLDDNTLLLQRYYTIDGGPGVSYSYFKRILPTASVWELETAELEGGDWELVSFMDEEGKELDQVPGMENLSVHLDVMGCCSVSWEEPPTGELVSGDAKWILGSGGGFLICEGEQEEAWFSGGILMHNIETMEESIYNLEMYLYYAGGVIKLVHVEGGGGENYGGEGVTEDFEESYVADRDGEQNFVDYLNSYESMVLRMDIPEITEQYLGIWVNGEYFTYDINQDSIDVADWVYLTK